MVKRKRAMEITKYYIKDILGRFSIKVSSNRKDIFIFATRRGGSTLLMEMIQSQKGVNFVDQPLDIWCYNPYKRWMPNVLLEGISDLGETGLNQLKSYFENIVLKGRLRVYSQWNIWDKDYKFFWDCLVVKILNAPYLIDWFADNFDVHIVYLVRHPIPTALSIIKENWGCTAKAFLNNSWLKENFLSDEQLATSRMILEEGTKLDKFVLEWCFSNLYPLKVFKERSWLTISYEELLLRNRKVSDLICERFELEDPEKMSKRVFKPSKTSSKQSQQDIESLGPAYLINRWRNEVDDKIQDKVMEILTVFDINAYTKMSAMPSEEICLFGSLRSEYE